MGCNADFGFSFGKKDDELRKQTIAFEPQIGLCSRPKGEYVGFELGILYKQYFKRHGIFSYTNDENKMRFGLFMAFYFQRPILYVNIQLGAVPSGAAPNCISDVRKLGAI